MANDSNASILLRSMSIRKEGARFWYQAAAKYADEGKHHQKQTCIQMTHRALDALEKLPLPDYGFISAYREFCNDLN